MYFSALRPGVMVPLHSNELHERSVEKLARFNLRSPLYDDETDFCPISQGAPNGCHSQIVIREEEITRRPDL